MALYYDPRVGDISEILRRGGEQQAKYLSQPSGVAAALPALGNLAQAGFDTAAAQQKKKSVLEAQQAYSHYLAKVDDGTATQQDHAVGRMAALSLGISPPDTLGTNLKKAQLADLSVDPKLMSVLQKKIGVEGDIPNTKENFTAADSIYRQTVENKEKRESALKGAKEKNDLKRITAFGTAMDVTRSRGGAASVSKQAFDRAERLQSLASAFPSGNMRSQEIEELAIGINSMLSGSNSGASEQVKSLMPNTIVGNANKIREWLTNDPTGTNQQALVKRMLGSVEREKATAGDQIKRTLMQRAVPYQDLEKTSPDEFYNILESNGITPDEYKKWRTGGFKQMSAVQSPESGGGTQNDPLGIR